MSPGAPILAGIGVFALCWIIQATMGDTSMFSTTYTDKGFLQGLLVNVTFLPGWVASVALVGAGLKELLGLGGTDDSSAS